MINLFCPNGCGINHGMVCGGDYPYWRRFGADCHQLGNIYFMMELEGEKFLKSVADRLEGDIELDDEDWKVMHDHAQGGCVSEPQCPECGEFLERYVPPTRRETLNVLTRLIEFGQQNWGTGYEFYVLAHLTQRLTDEINGEEQT